MPAYLSVPLGVALLFVPGLFWESIAASRRGMADHRDAAARMADAAAVSLALLALGGMVTFFLPVHFTGPVLWALAVLLAAGLVWRRFRNHPSIDPEPFEYRHALPLLALAAVLLFRFYQARTLALPAWVDSIHHSLLVRMILEDGGLPQRLEPFIQAPLVYHSGFHSAAAVFAYFSGLDPAQAVLVLGQILNAGAALGVYRLANALQQDRRRAITAMLLVGFAFQMPAYYLTWGRVTLLAGLMLLLPAMAALLEAWRQGAARSVLLRLGLLTTGLVLTHYFAAGLWLMFLGVFGLYLLLADRPFLRSPDLRRIAGAVAAGGLAAAPWLVHVSVNASAFIDMGITLAGEPPDSGYLDYLWYLLGPYRSHVLHGLGLAGLASLGWRRAPASRSGLPLFSLFTLALVAISLPWAPRFGPFRPDHAVILAFFPAAVFAAELLAAPLGFPLPPRVHLGVKVLFAAALAGLTVWGILETRTIVNPVTILADDRDVQALDWIAENTPKDAVFLINVAAWQGGAYRGVDGGWWISPYTGRRTFLPPALYLDAGTEEVNRLISQAAAMAEITTCDADLRELAVETGATHVYTRFGKGALQPAGLAACEGVRLRYEEGGVFVFEVLRQE